MATSGLINIGGGSSTPMTGATSLLDGQSGGVPQPLAGDEAKLLSGAGTWVEGAVNTVAENGIVYPSSNVTINSGNTSPATSVLFYTFTLPSAGEWEVNYVTRMSQSVSSNSVYFGVGVFDNGVIVPNTELNTVQDSGSGGLGGTGTGVVKLTTTGAKTYQIRVWELNTVGGQALSDTNGRSYVFYNKIAGQLPFTGQTVDYVNGVGTNNTYGNATALVTNTLAGNIPNVSGVYTLTAGKTYRLQGSVKIDVANSILYFQWRNITAGTLIGAKATNLSANNTVQSFSDQAIAEAIITPSTNITVHLENTTGSSININAAESWVTITQLGSSAISTTTRVNVICRNKIAQSLTNNVWNSLTNWTEIQDPTNSFNAVTGVFTAPRTATYQFSTGNAVGVALGQYVGQSVILNGATQLYNFIISAGAGATQFIQTNGTIEMTVGQTLQAQTFNGGLPVNDSVSAGNSWFTITEINPTF